MTPAASERPKHILELDRVSKRFGGIVANDGISLAVRAGSIAGLIGPNGSGKTTLFNSIAGHHAVDAGGIRFDGRDLARLTSAQVARLGLIRTFQQAHIYEGLTARENLLVSESHARENRADLLRKPRRALGERAAELLAFVGLAAKSEEKAGRLSYGERKLLELAMALMSEPRMLLLDEPTAGVNPAMIERITERIRLAVRSFGVTLIIIEHNLRVVMALADEIHCLAHGKLLASGSPAQISDDPRVIEAYLGSR